MTTPPPSVADLRKKFAGLDPNKLPPRPQRPPPQAPPKDTIQTAKPEEKKVPTEPIKIQVKLEQKLVDTIETQKEKEEVRDPSPDLPHEKKKPLKARVMEMFAPKEKKPDVDSVTKESIEEEKKKTEGSPEKPRKGSFIASLFKRKEEPEVQISGPYQASGTGEQFPQRVLPKVMVPTICLQDEEQLIEETKSRELSRSSTLDDLSNLSNLTSKSSSVISTTSTEFVRNISKTSSRDSNQSTRTDGSGDSKKKEIIEPRLEKGGWSSSYEKIKEAITPGMMVAVKFNDSEKTSFARVGAKVFEKEGFKIYFLADSFQERKVGAVDLKADLDAGNVKIRIAKNEELPFKPGSIVIVNMVGHEKEPFFAQVDSFEKGEFLVRSFGKRSTFNLKDSLEKETIRVRHANPDEITDLKYGGWSSSYDEIKSVLRPGHVIAIDRIDSKKLEFARVALRAYVGHKFSVSYPSSTNIEGVFDLTSDVEEGKIKVRLARQDELQKETRFGGVPYSQNANVKSPENYFLEDYWLNNQGKS